jgi:hypothetical protein
MPKRNSMVAGVGWWRWWKREKRKKSRPGGARSFFRPLVGEGKKAVFRPGGTASPLYVSFVSSPLEMVRVWIAQNTHGEIERGSDERIGGRREEEAFFLVSIDGRLLFDFFDAKKSARVLGSSDKTGRASSGSSKSKRHTGASPREREQKKKRR